MSKNIASAHTIQGFISRFKIKCLLYWQNSGRHNNPHVLKVLKLKLYEECKHLSTVLYLATGGAVLFLATRVAVLFCTWLLVGMYCTWLLVGQYCTVPGYWWGCTVPGYSWGSTVLYLATGGAEVVCLPVLLEPLLPLLVGEDPGRVHARSHALLQISQPVRVILKTAMLLGYTTPPPPTTLGRRVGGTQCTQVELVTDSLKHRLI